MREVKFRMLSPEDVKDPLWHMIKWLGPEPIPDWVERTLGSTGEYLMIRFRDGSVMEYEVYNGS